MSKNTDAQDAVAELKKGLGHLFKAAKTAVNDLPTKDFEDAVLTGVKEVGRALGNVKDTLETELLGKTEGAHAHASPSPSAPPASPTQNSASTAAPSAPPAEASAPAHPPVAPAAAAAPPSEQVRISADPPAPAADKPTDPDTGAGI